MMAQPMDKTFSFRTPAQAMDILMELIGEVSRLKEAELALFELMINAIEHGNLGITYEEKTTLLQTDKVREEIERRLSDERYADRIAALTVINEPDRTLVVIEDEGEGFAWQEFLDTDLSEVKGRHGRGITLAQSFCTSLTYEGRGNRVIAEFK